LAGYGFTTPITGPLSLPIVKRILTHKVLAAVLRAKAYGKSNPRDTGAKDAEDVANALLYRIGDPDDTFDLVDAIRITEEKDQSLVGADALEGSSDIDYPVPITRYTRF
jgi:hypothetical protein